MGLFRKEPLHQRLAREGGLLDEDREDLRPSWDKVGVHGVHRPREWDAVATVEAPDLRGEQVEFVVLPDSTLIVEDEEEDADLSPLADAVEQRLPPPYRAGAVARGYGLWAVAARAIEVAGFAADGEEVVLTAHDGARTLTVDGVDTFGTIPELEALGRRVGEAYVVRARRIDGELWEVQVDRL